MMRRLILAGVALGVVITSLLLWSAASAQTVVGGGGSSTCSGDLNVTCSQVTGISHASGFAQRKTATDANSYLYWSLDEGALPFANGIVAQGTNGNFNANGSAAWSFLAYPAMFSNGPMGLAAARYGSEATNSTALSPALPVTIWYWYRTLSASVPSNLDGVFKTYRAAGTWTAPFDSVGVGISSSVITVSATVSGVQHAQAGIAVLQTVGWNLIYGTYDGVNLCVGANGFPMTCGAQTGAIDYNANAGIWEIGMADANATNWQGQVDEVHVDTVARTNGYFATVWQTATGQGGN